MINNVTNPNKGLTHWHAQFKVVAFNPLTSKYLHMSGDGETSERDYAWSGQRSQFANLEKTLDVDYELQSAVEKADG